MLALATLALLAAAAFWQFQRAEALEAEVTILTGELAVANLQLTGALEALEGYRERMASVRGSVDLLASELDALRDLVSEEPLPSPSPPLAP